MSMFSLKPKAEGQRLGQFGFHHVMLVLAVVVVGVIGFVGWKVVSKNKIGQSNSSSATSSQKQSSGGSCDGSKPLFTEPFTELDKVDALGALGGVVGGSPGRSYIGVKKGMEVAVYNPGEAVLETVVYARRGGQGTAGEYGLYFRFDCGITYLLDHIQSVSDEIRALSPKEPADSSRTDLGTRPNKTIKAGQLIGHTKGTSLAGTFDFLVEDSTKKAFHINEKRWDWAQAVDSVCPYDLYTEELKAKHYALIGEMSGTSFMKAESCGGPSQDVAGTASGGWFQGDSTAAKGKWLAIGKQFDRVELGIRSSGDFTFSLKDYSPKTMPDKITPGNKVCYQGYSNNWAYINLVSETQLSLATGSGKCPSAFPDSQAERWDR